MISLSLKRKLQILCTMPRSFEWGIGVFSVVTGPVECR
jgi:hypothetical protein